MNIQFAKKIIVIPVCF